MFQSVMSLLNIGYGNYVLSHRIVAILNPASAPMKRLREIARERNRLLDVTHGRRTRSIIVMDSEHVLLSAVQPDTIAGRLHSTSREAD